MTDFPVLDIFSSLLAVLPAKRRFSLDSGLSVPGADEASLLFGLLLRKAALTSTRYAVNICLS